MPGAYFTDKSLTKQLRELGLIADKAEGKAAYKRIKGNRYLEISLELLRKRAVKF